MMFRRAKTFSLFDLPLDVMRHHILLFLDHVELSILDRACLNHCYGQREYLLAAYHGLYLNLNGPRESVSPEIAHWVVARGMFFSTLHLRIDYSSSQLYRKLFSQCRDLTSLYLKSGNCSSLAGAVLSMASQYCHQLKLLDTSACNSMTDRGVESLLEHCPSLKFLNLSNCTEISDRTLRALVRNQTSLKSLRMANCDVSDAALKAVFRHSPNLMVVQLTHCDASDSSIVALAQNCPNLHLLDLGGTFEVSDVSLIALSEGCAKLSSIDVSCCDITDNGVQALVTKCRGLKTLAMADCSFLSHQIFAYMPSTLEEVNLSDCWGVSDRSVQLLLAACRNIKSLNLEFCSEISDSAFEPMQVNAGSVAPGGEGFGSGSAGHSPFCHLESIVLTGCPRITDRTISAIIKGTRDGILPLQHVECDGCTFLSDSAVISLLNCCPMLTHANFSQCFNLGDGSISVLAAMCPRLEVLKIARCDKVTDHSLSLVLAHCAELCTLDLSGCYNISDAALMRFRSDRGLVYLDATNCPLVSDEGLSTVLSRSPHLSFFSIGTTSSNSITSNEKFCPSIDCRRKQKRKPRKGGGGASPRCPHLTAKSFALLEKCPELSVLKLNGSMPDLTDECLSRVVTTLPRLEEVDISGSALITDSGLSSIARKGRGTLPLRELNVSGLDKITARGVALIAQSAGPALQRLEVAGCRRLTDAAFVAIAGNCSHLEHLNMAGCILVTNATPAALSSKCAELLAIDLSYCFSVSSLRDFAQCHYLQRVTLRKVENVLFLISDQDIVYLHQHCPELESVAVVNTSISA